MKVVDMPYTRIDAEKFDLSCRALAQEAACARDGAALVKAREKFVETRKDVTTDATLAEIRYYLNTADAFYATEKEYYDEISPELGVSELAFYKAFLASPHLAEAVKSGKLNPLVEKLYAARVRASDPKTVALEIEENKLVTRYIKIMSDLTVPFRGEVLPFTVLKKYFTDSSRATRREAYCAFGTALAACGEEIDDIFDKLIAVRNRAAREMGYDNFVPLGYDRLERIGFTRQDADDFAENVLQECVPIVAKLKSEVAARLGLDKVAVYDNDSYFACGNPCPVLNSSEMFEAARQMYAELDEAAGAFFEDMLAANAFDVQARKGKWGGGFCTSIPRYRQPFILANFNGTSGDVDVLTHEAGHAFADWMLYKTGGDYELGVGGMETAETHSMSMEFFCHRFADRFFGARGGDYREMHLGDALTFIPYGVAVDRFQHLVYEQTLDAKARREAWLSLEHTFRPYLDYDGVPYLSEGTRWQYQMHIFEQPFYYIDYCFAQTAALEFYLAALDDHRDAFSRYKVFLMLGGSKPFAELLREAGLKSPFDKGVVGEVAAQAKSVFDRLSNR